MKSLCKKPNFEIWFGELSAKKLMTWTQKFISAALVTSIKPDIPSNAIVPSKDEKEKENSSYTRGARVMIKRWQN